MDNATRVHSRHPLRGRVLEQCCCCIHEDWPTWRRLRVLEVVSHGCHWARSGVCCADSGLGAYPVGVNFGLLDVDGLSVRLGLARCGESGGSLVEGHVAGAYVPGFVERAVPGCEHVLCRTKHRVEGERVSRR